VGFNLGFGACALEFELQVLGLRGGADGFGFRGLGRVRGLGLRISGLGFGAQDLGFGAWGLGLRVQNWVHGLSFGLWG